MKKAGNQQFSIIKKHPEIFIGGFCRKLIYFLRNQYFLLNAIDIRSQDRYRSIGVNGKVIGFNRKYRFLKKLINFRQNPDAKISGCFFMVENC